MKTERHYQDSNKAQLAWTTKNAEDDWQSIKNVRRTGYI